MAQNNLERFGLKWDQARLKCADSALGTTFIDSAA